MKMFWRRRLGSQQASAWFSRVRSGKVDSKMDQAWSDWMAADVDHQIAYEKRELAWELSSELEYRPKIQALLADVDTTLQVRRAARLHPVLRLSWQAGLAALAVIGVSTYFLMNRVTISEFATATGEQRVVTLADESVVSLNTGTKIRVLYSRAARRVELLQGEAYFKVFKDGSRPFEVEALQGLSTALGTQFDVQVDTASVSVSVLEGMVAVSPDGSAVNREQLSAGQAIDYARDGTKSATRAADMTRIRGWQARKIVFNDVPLNEALREYNRYIEVPIVLGNPALATRRINGVFQVGDENAFLGALRNGLHVRVTATDSQTVLDPP